jgi:transcriptional regulator with XRE-family HTH domain
MDALREILRLRNMSQRDLAKALGTTDATVSRYVRGGIKPPTHVLQKMAELLRVEPGELSGDYPLMSDDEREVLAAYRKLPEAARSVALSAIRAMAPGEQPAAQPDLREAQKKKGE